MLFVGNRVRQKGTGATGLLVKAAKYPNGTDKFLVRWASKRDAFLVTGMNVKECWIDGRDKSFVKGD